MTVLNNDRADVLQEVIYKRSTESQCEAFAKGKFGTAMRKLEKGFEMPVNQLYC
jgi:hypothetical protein